MSLLRDLRPFLADEIARAGVPGASLAVLKEGAVHEAAAGVVNLDTGIEATPEAIFQIGSITKPVTATLAMQLVEEGRLDLDAPVRAVLPDFAVDDADVAATVTARHLLDHSSGIDGDFFVDSGRGDGAVARLLELGRTLRQLHPMGRGFSYCNFGFAVLGRMIEVLRGASWDAALQAGIARPLGAGSFVSRPEDCLRHRTAVGHLGGGPYGRKRVAPFPYLAFGMGPAGATPTARARDLILFAEAHLTGGLVSPETAAAMQVPSNPLPVRPGGVAHFGLGWMIFDWGGVRLFGHDGATIGQNAFLRILPAEGIAVALLANGGDMQGLAHRVLGAVFGELAGIRPPEPTDGEEDEVEPSGFVGVFERRSARLTVRGEGGQLLLRSSRRTIGRRRSIPIRPGSGCVRPATVRPSRGFRRDRTFHRSRDSWIAGPADGIRRSSWAFGGTTGPANSNRESFESVARRSSRDPRGVNRVR